MKAMKLIVIAILCYLSCTLVHAQDFDKIIQVSWDINQPLSNKDWIDNTSTRGVKFGYRKLMDDRFMVGADVSWASYDAYQPSTTIEYAGGAFTTDYFKYVYSYGITIAGDYILPVGNKDHILPFAGLGIGASLNTFTTYYNIYQDRENSWGFLVSPKVGAIVPFGRKIGAMAAVHYDFSTSKHEAFGYDNFSNIGLQVGIVFLSY